MQQVTMGRVDFHHFEACGQRALGGGDKIGDHLLNLALVQWLGLGVLGVEGNRRWPYRRPAAILRFDAAVLADPRPMSAGLAPGMGQLNAGHRALGRNETCDALQRFDLCVIPQAQVLGGDAAIGSHGGGFSENQPGAADSTAAEVYQVPVISQAIDA